METTKTKAKTENKNEITAGQMASEMQNEKDKTKLHYTVKERLIMNELNNAGISDSEILNLAKAERERLGNLISLEAALILVAKKLNVALTIPKTNGQAEFVPRDAITSFACPKCNKKVYLYYSTKKDKYYTCNSNVQNDFHNHPKTGPTEQTKKDKNNEK